MSSGFFVIGDTQQDEEAESTVATDSRPRCEKCNHLLAEEVTRPWKIRCRCKHLNERQN